MRGSIGVAERLHRLDFRDAHSFVLHHSIQVPCSGVDHMDFSADGRYAYASCEFSGQMIEVDLRTQRVIATWTLPAPASPDMGGVSVNGRTLWLSGRYNAEVYAISTRTGRLLHRIPVGDGPHGMCVWPQPGRYSLGHTGIMR